MGHGDGVHGAATDLHILPTREIDHGFPFHVGHCVPSVLSIANHPVHERVNASGNFDISTFTVLLHDPID